MIERIMNLESVVSFRLSDNEKRELEILSRKLNTSKSNLLRTQIRQFLIKEKD